ncbi:monovalent cation/H+ antiporter subunit D [Rhizobiaceae bacterium BDR2-2]|uniref:Monovalent cation/H+ antiporter subunit D n=1 Tax=Ectorhizobium quercum TaxID=2965071 RepID=A0AAE3N210_9HYPH|nr:monovalent cation/H+ antiporter subunit D [Ectorhizobium quercum]MCX8999543.1 monovalent cation/H+ antiporter subunit D [Ectorhizobium quercum]
MSGLAHHLIIAPVLVPLAAAAIMLFIEDRNRTAKAMISLGSTVVMLTVALLLLRMAHDMDSSAGNAGGVYLLGNWPAPFGIVLVLDKLSAMMLMLTATLSIPALAFSLARWHNAGAHFHTLFQLMLMGLNGAFLTGDLFNLFVFFEVMLAASYGLLLHGSGQQRVKAGLHYLVINLASALLFLIGVSLVYGTAGTLNMADLALRLPDLAPDRRVFLEAGLAVLGVVFLIKAGTWPLNFWLPTAYSAASAPVAGIFAILSKLGIYILLRLVMLTSGDDGTLLTDVARFVLMAAGMATVTFGAIGVLASQALGRLAGYSVLVSSGTLLLVIGFGGADAAAGALFYLISSTLTIAAFFLLIELIERGQDAGASVLAVSMEVYGDVDEDDSDDEIGVIMPGTMAVLAVCFSACAILLSGLPPLSGFVAKFTILTGMIGAGGGVIGAAAWLSAGLIIVSGLCALIAMTRSGIRTFWASIEGTVPRVLVIEVAPVLMLLTLTLALTVGAGPVMRYMEQTAAALSEPRNYINAVFEARRVGQEATRP